MRKLARYELRVAGKRRGVETLKEASEEFCRLRDTLELGASKMPDGTVIDRITKDVIGRVGYNGRVWKAEPWRPDSVPLYDNQPPNHPYPAPVQIVEPEMRQEVWFTLRLKGEMIASADAKALAQQVLAHIEKILAPQDSIGSFSVCQPGDVIEVEEEAQIYHPEALA